MKTSLPTALIYGWDRFGEIRLESDVYHEENLYEKKYFGCGYFKRTWNNS